MVQKASVRGLLVAAVALFAPLLESTSSYAPTVSDLMRENVKAGHKRIAGLGRKRQIDEARRVFASLTPEELDARAHASLLDALARVGRGAEALQIYEGMNSSGIMPDRACYQGLVRALCAAGDLPAALALLKSPPKGARKAGAWRDLLECDFLRACLKQGQVTFASELHALLNETKDKVLGASANALLAQCYSQVEPLPALPI
jgi:pentatricopeptide repeat protein